VVFLAIHPFNFVLALLARLFGPVAYWKAEGLPAFALTLFEEIEPGDFIDSATWNDLLQEAHTGLKRQVTQTPRLPFAIRGIKADFGCLWLHWFAHEFEADVLGQHLALKWSKVRGRKQCLMLRSGVFRWAKVAGVLPLVVEGVIRVPGSGLVDGLWQIAKSLRIILGVLIRCSIPEKIDAKIRGRQFRYMFVAISPSVQPYEPQQIDFAFLVRRKLLPGDKCIYVPLRALENTQATALAETGAALLPVGALTGFLSVSQLAGLIGTIMLAISGSLVRGGRAGDVLCGLVARGIPIFVVARHLRIETFVAGLAQGLLESPAVPLLSAAGIHTIVWQHASVGFSHGWGAHFKNLVLEQSVFASSVVCVWTPADKHQLIDRALLEPPNGPTLSIIGPLMPGDSRWLRRPPIEARQALGLDERPGRRIISVFDLPTFMHGFRRQYRIPVERISQETQQAFFEDMLAALLQFSEVDIVLKPKRRDDPRIYVGRVLRELSDPESCWRKSRRLFLLNPDVDPYLPIAVADLCIGMPFTSPIVAAINAGLPAFWYDPNGFVEHPYPTELGQILVRGREELFARLAAWIEAEKFAVPATLLSNIADPGMAFADILKGSGALDEPFDVHSLNKDGTP
jgi:hypothetical protein